MVQLYNRDCLDVMAEMDDQSIDLIATDPPYYRVKSDDWDNQWATQSEFLEWMESCVIQFARLLKPTGSLYLFSGHKLASTVEAIIGKYLNVENHIVWLKPSGMHCRQNRASLRRYFPQSERIIFATSKLMSGAKAEHRAIGKACTPIINYFRTSLRKSGLTQSDVDRELDTQMSGHWFGSSQWRLPNSNRYSQLQILLKGNLNRPYDQLKRQHDRLVSGARKPAKRPFNVAGSDWYTDVWTCQPVQYYPGKHPCEKPLDLIKHIVTASSLPGQLVFDPFLGGGTTAVAALETGREFEGCELDPEIFQAATQRINAVRKPVA